MAVPKYDELMKPLLAAVKDGEVYKIKDVTAVLAQQLNLSAEDLAEMLFLQNFSSKINSQKLQVRL